jgi:shikimate kinase
MDNIYFSGLIGSGKTALGQALAGRLGWPFQDLDSAMQLDANKDFRQVVAEEGWLGFRVREYRICKQFARMERTVVALGGGTVRYEWNRDVLRGTGVTILLVTDLGELADRVRANDRPRVHPGTTLEQDLAMIWGTYRDLYYSLADVVYETVRGKTIAQEIDELIEILRQKQLVRSGLACRQV